MNMQREEGLRAALLSDADGRRDSQVCASTPRPARRPKSASKYVAGNRHRMSHTRFTVWLCIWRWDRGTVGASGGAKLHKHRRETMKVFRLKKVCAIVALRGRGSNGYRVRGLPLVGLRLRRRWHVGMHLQGRRPLPHDSELASAHRVPIGGLTGDDSR